MRSLCRNCMVGIATVVVLSLSAGSAVAATQYSFSSPLPLGQRVATKVANQAQRDAPAGFIVTLVSVWKLGLQTGPRQRDCASVYAYKTPSGPPTSLQQFLWQGSYTITVRHQGHKKLISINAARPGSPCDDATAPGSLGDGDL
jgi:hypothetical protein